MKKVLYIGINTYGSTSKMRADRMRKILSDWEMDLIDTDIPYNKMNRIFKSLACRYKIGPTIWTINKYIMDNLPQKFYDLIWVDKGIFITRKTSEVLRKMATRLVHYTPDPAFTFHQSKHFYSSMPLYDYMITTKSFEIDDFVRMMGSKEKVLYCTQGFDKDIHRPLVAFENKKGVSFLGRCEKERMEAVEYLLNEGIDVTLAGGGNWNDFVKNHESKHLNWLGGSVEGEDYVKTISGSLFAWGAVSKWIPERHTTRTFEIPACKTALLTERNDELESFFNDDEVIFYDSLPDLVKKIRYYEEHRDELNALTEKGYAKVQSGNFDFDSQMRNLLNAVLK